MQFLGTISNGKPLFEDVVGTLDVSGVSGRFVLKAGEHLSTGNYVLAISATDRIAVDVFYSAGDPVKPLYYEFRVTNALGLAN